MDKATETGSALQIFKDRVTAVKFAADKKKDCDKKCSTVASSNKKQTKNADESKKEEVSEVSAVTPDKKITANDLKDLFSKRMMNKIGNKIIVSYIVLPGKNTVIVIIDICRERNNKEGDFERNVSTCIIHPILYYFNTLIKIK